MVDAKPKSITIGKKDAVFNKWRLAILNNGERALSFTIKKALLTYIQEGEFIDLGKIHFDPIKDRVDKRANINLWIDDSQLLVKWIRNLEENKIPVAKIIKEIIIRCIEIVPENIEEYIPTYYDLFLSSSAGNILDELPRFSSKEDQIRSEHRDIAKGIESPKEQDKPIAVAKKDIVNNPDNRNKKNDGRESISIIQQLKMGNRH